MNSTAREDILRILAGLKVTPSPRMSDERLLFTFIDTVQERLAECGIAKEARDEARKLLKTSEQIGDTMLTYRLLDAITQMRDEMYKMEERAVGVAQSLIQTYPSEDLELNPGEFLEFVTTTKSTNLWLGHLIEKYKDYSVKICPEKLHYLHVKKGMWDPRKYVQKNYQMTKLVSQFLEADLPVEPVPTGDPDTDRLERRLYELDAPRFKRRYLFYCSFSQPENKETNHAFAFAVLVRERMVIVFNPNGRNNTAKYPDVIPFAEILKSNSERIHEVSFNIVESEIGALIGGPQSGDQRLSLEQEKGYCSAYACLFIDKMATGDDPHKVEAEMIANKRKYGLDYIRSYANEIYQNFKTSQPEKRTCLEFLDDLEEDDTDLLQNPYSGDLFRKRFSNGHLNPKISRTYRECFVDSVPSKLELREMIKTVDDDIYFPPTGELVELTIENLQLVREYIEDLIPRINDETMRTDLEAFIVKLEKKKESILARRNRRDRENFSNRTRMRDDIADLRDFESFDTPSFESPSFESPSFE